MPRKRALAILLVSLWLAWTLSMWFAATQSFATAYHALDESPQAGFVRLIHPASSARTILMGFAGQVNGDYFRAYGVAQIVLGILVLLVLASLQPEEKITFALAMAMLVIVVALAVFVAPQISRLGSVVNLNPASPVAPRFWMLHGLYTGLDGAKLLMAAFILGKWIVVPAKS